MPYANKKAKLKSDFIDLGEELKSGGMTISMGSEESEESPKYHYPSLYFDNVKGLEKLGKEGMAVIHYKKVMERFDILFEKNLPEKGGSFYIQSKLYFAKEFLMQDYPVEYNQSKFNPGSSGQAEAKPEQQEPKL